MKNKVEVKKLIIKCIILTVLVVLSLGLFNMLEYNVYVQNYNNRIITIASNLKQKYPDLTDNDIIALLNSDTETTNIFSQYGFNIENEAIIKENNDSFTKFILLETAVIFIFAVSISIIYIRYNRKRNSGIKEITNLIDKINHRNYELKIEEITEDELSILKNEIYKTTLMLREETDNSLKDKIELKKFLEDISHQLKTPLTAILINLDNLIDNPELDIETREKFLREIKNKTYSIKFLIESLLKLSKFDVNTITFNQTEVKIKDLIDQSIENVMALADLRNVKISAKGNNTDTMFCDYKWEIEAITNLLKNAIEHSDKETTVEVMYETNNVYTKISIKNHGKEISQKDMLHIFDRFYKGENSPEDNVGIGLALAKAIIEKDGARITVKSNMGITEFIITKSQCN